MRLEGNELRLSASDLTGHLNCRHLTQLELQVARGATKRPAPWDPSLEVLWQRGLRHEHDYVAHLAESGLEISRIDGTGIDDSAVAATAAAMRAGATIIVQAALRQERWIGRADVLRKVSKASALGDWSYEVYDTKLARETKANTILQLSLYSDLLAKFQGIAPDHMHVVAPWTDFVPKSYRVADYAAYYRRICEGLSSATCTDLAESYPTPKSHCDICAWRAPCRQRRRDDDHLSLVAGISSLQIAELTNHGVDSLAALAAMPLPLQWKPERGSKSSYERIQQQAAVQLRSRDFGKLVFDLVAAEPPFGLAALPAPSSGDIYLDFEGDPFVGENGQEYLLGYHHIDQSGSSEYVGLWGLTRDTEKHAFENFVDFVMTRWIEHPELHIYHYGAYEPAALKRLMGRHATREEELDQILRAKLLVDLLTVVRQGVRVGVESYSIKRLEPLYEYKRRTDLPDANVALTKVQTSLELGEVADISAKELEVVQSYNQDDCVSTRYLHLWLEMQRDAVVASGQSISRPPPGTVETSEAVSEWIARITPLVDQLTMDVPVDEAERSPEQHGRWLLAHLLDFHRREDKATWWEYFRLAALASEDLVDEKAGLGALTYEAKIGGTAKAPVHRYSFLPQETDARPGKKLRSVGGDLLGEIVNIDAAGMTVDIKKRKDTAEVHPEAVFMHEHIGSEPMMEALVRLAEFVVAHGLTGEGEHQAQRDLLLRTKPSVGVDGVRVLADESTLDAARRIAGKLNLGVLPIQGPPGAGKTHTGARMIIELVRRGKRVGIVANSHAVIRLLIAAVIDASASTGAALRCVIKPKDKEDEGARLKIVDKNEELLIALQSDCQVAGATAWFWSSPAALLSVDVLFVDEAAQMSLANVLAVSQAAKAVVLLGDPQQLDQPMQGSHPEGTDRSALDHLINGAQTISPEQGLFLEETWRLHPAICSFTSEIFYEGKLRSRPGLDRQLVKRGPIAGFGLRCITVAHIGNTNRSLEEVDIVVHLVSDVLASDATWIDQHGEEKRITLHDILVITPYNAQVYELQKRLPQARIGTVDKFQGQEAPIAIYSLATSSHTDAPRGMEFLYSLNRLNVATSRARCASIVVCSPELFEAECRTPRQMQLANAFCRFRELAGTVR